MCLDAETCVNCKMDCGECPAICGDAQCNGDETCATCENDCGTCAPVCGDNECNGNESCNTCAADCGMCLCPCSNDPEFSNFCHYGPNTPNCAMTQPGGYCDPNGDGSYQDGDWDQGWYDYNDQCN